MMRMKKRKNSSFCVRDCIVFCAILLGLCWGSYEISVHEVIATLLEMEPKYRIRQFLESVYRVSCLVFLWRQDLRYRAVFYRQ